MAETPPVRRVAVALFEGFTVLDVYGPVQAFAACRMPREDGTFQRLFEIFSMAEQSGVVQAGEGPASYAEYSFANAPAFDILLIPGGFGTRTAVNNAPFLSQLAAATKSSPIFARSTLPNNAPPCSSSPG